MAAITRKPSLSRQIANFFYQHPSLGLFLLLLPPLAWLLVVYLGSLAALLVQSFYTIDPMSMLVKEEFTFATYEELFTAANLDVIKRTVYMAAAVTVGCAVLAFPLAYYMARYAPPRIKGLLYLA
ncbi:MAG: ABC transporter permease, partial [Anaerolineae bacterium]|nr:ABC transporter permease [Anaerolineae bacterium]